AEASAVICLSHAEQSALEKRLPHQRIFYLPNGVNCQEFQTKPTISPRTEWGIPTERRLLLCISRIDYQKNQAILLESLAELPDTHLLLVGPVTSQTYCEQLLQRAHELDVASRLTLIPGLPPDDPRLKAILHEADVFVLPSIHEPFGIVALEAWAAGLPVVAARVGGLPDFIVHEHNGLLFSPQDARELTAQISRILTRNELRDKLVANALADVQKFSWDNLGKRLADLYHEFLNA
ncbi:MAG: glycosyltransferase family 4 protein, partial [Victivallales bacterium]|nr:glycosyltransferase family 4 protein [Victivallales bacterium]